MAEPDPRGPDTSSDTRRFLLPALIAIGITAASVQPLPTTGGPPLVPILPADTVAHVLGYALLAGSTAWAVPTWAPNPWRVGLLVFGSVVLYGAGIEVVQAFLPTRSFSLADMAANAIGAALGIAVARWPRN